MARSKSKMVLGDCWALHNEGMIMEEERQFLFVDNARVDVLTSSTFLMSLSSIKFRGVSGLAEVLKDSSI